MYTDTCNTGVGRVLLQRQPDESDKPIGYKSRTINDNKNLLVTRYKECVTVIWAMLLFQSFLDGNRSMVRIASKALKMAIKYAGQLLEIDPITFNTVTSSVWYSTMRWHQTASLRYPLKNADRRSGQDYDDWQGLSLKHKPRNIWGRT